MKLAIVGSRTFNDYDMLVDFELDHNQWNELLTYLDQLQSNWNSLRGIIEDLGIDYLLDKMNELEKRNEE